MKAPLRSAARRLIRLYQATVIVLGQTLIAFALVNFGLFLVFELKDRYAPGPALLSDLPPGEARELERETRLASTTLVYDPFTQFAEESPRAGRHVNIHDAGFRVSAGQGTWPADPDNLNIFLFGVSTTFGYGVADDQTIASYLEAVLSRDCPEGPPVRVYNFGRAAYYSSQERILFERLLVGGHVPDVAIFIDGLNDLSRPTDVPAFTDELRLAFGQGPWLQANLYRSLARGLPMVRATRALVGRLSPERAPASDHPSGVESAAAEAMLTRYRASTAIVEAVARAQSVHALFVWQPVPTYGYDLSYHRAWRSPPAAFPLLRAGYEGMAALSRRGALGESFLWGAEIQRGLTESLYVDAFHYSPVLCARLAELIGQALRERGMLSVRSKRQGRASLR